MQWLRICLPVQKATDAIPGPRRFTCCGTTEPTHHNYRSPHALEPKFHSKRSQSNEKPTHHNYRLALHPKLEKACRKQRRPSIAKKNKEKKNLNTSLSVYKRNDTIPEIYFKILQQNKVVNRTRKAEY